MWIRFRKKKSEQHTFYLNIFVYKLNQPCVDIWRRRVLHREIRYFTSYSIYLNLLTRFGRVETYKIGSYWYYYWWNNSIWIRREFKREKKMDEKKDPTKLIYTPVQFHACFPHIFTLALQGFTTTVPPLPALNVTQGLVINFPLLHLSPILASWLCGIHQKTIKMFIPPYFFLLFFSLFLLLSLLIHAGVFISTE